MTEAKLRGWAKTRAMGRPAFVLKHGILGWGLPTAILWSICVGADEGFASLPVLLIISLMIFPAGGYVFGRVLWAVFERIHSGSESASPNA